MSKSTNGTTWSAVTRVPIGVTRDNQDHFIPGIAVDRSTSGSSAHIAVTYYYYPNRSCSRSTCQLDVGFISSTTAGSSWGITSQLAGPMSLNWLPNTTQGRMVGDYISTSFASGLAHGFFAVASAPPGGTDCSTATPKCHQALTTNTAGLSHLEGGSVTSTGDHPVPDAASDPPAPASPITLR
jgi:hypothetical protein